MKSLYLIVTLMALSWAIASTADADCAGCCWCSGDGESWDCVDGGAQGWLVCLGGGANPCTTYDPCGVGGGCFLGDVPITTDRGPVEIQDLSIGDNVLSFDQSTGETKYGAVTRTYRLIQVGFYIVNGSLEVTASHPFLVDGGWKCAEDLGVGDTLTRDDGSRVAVVTIDYIDRGVRVYNIEVDGAHTFYADGYLVHNKGPGFEG